MRKAPEVDDLYRLRHSAAHVLAQQEPFGAVVVDGRWNLLQMNRGAQRLFAKFPPQDLQAARNLIVGTLHPNGLRPYIVNWDEVAGLLVARLHREVSARPADEELQRLLVRVLALPGVPAEWRVPAPGRGARAKPWAGCGSPAETTPLDRAGRRARALQTRRATIRDRDSASRSGSGDPSSLRDGARGGASPGAVVRDRKR